MTALTRLTVSKWYAMSLPCFKNNLIAVQAMGYSMDNPQISVIIFYSL
jgi:hypothetical protein